MTQLQIHDVERIVLEDGESENYTWVRIYFHRRNKEVVEVVAHPAQGRDGLRVQQPADPDPDFADLDEEEEDERRRARAAVGMPE